MNDLMQNFINVIDNTKMEFTGYLDEDTYIHVHYSGWHKKNVKDYKIEIYEDECGCTYNKIHRFSNIEEAILFAIDHVKNNHCPVI